MICTFFGHSDCSDEVKPYVEARIREMIKTKNASAFYVGTHGHFDRYVLLILRKLKKEFPHINYYAVLSNFPRKADDFSPYSSLETLIPDGLEEALPRFRINYVNEWMIKKADIVIGYVRYSFGGAKKFFEKAKKKGRFCINIFDDMNNDIK